MKRKTEKILCLPRVFITPEAKQKLDLYIQLAEGEISGLGTVIQLGNDFLITDVFIFEQECTTASTVLSTEEISRFLLEAIKEGRDISQLKLWWHSHSSMSVFWSATDESTISSFSNEWIISIVGNKEGDYLVRLDLFEPIRLTLDELEFQIKQPENPILKNKIEEEIQKKVKMNFPFRKWYSKYFNFEVGEAEGGDFDSSGKNYLEDSNSRKRR